jgi:hypothetical protein
VKYPQPCEHTEMVSPLKYLPVPKYEVEPLC